MDIEALFKGKPEAVLEEFKRDLETLQRMIDGDLNDLEHAKEEIRNCPEMDWGEKAKLDATINASHKRVIDGIRVKDQMLERRSNFVKSREIVEAEEALTLSLRAFLQVARSTLTPKQYDKLRKSMEPLVNKTVAELRDFVTGVTD